MALTLEQLTELVEQQAERIKILEAAESKRNAVPVQTPVNKTSRRRMIGKLAGTVLAGGAAVSLGLASGTQEVQARFISNPSTNTNIGALVTRPGAAVSGTIAPSNFFGLVASADSPFNLGDYTYSPVNSGVMGLSLDGYGVLGTSNTGTGIYGVGGIGPNSIGVSGFSTGGNGVLGDANTFNKAGLVANNENKTGLAFEVRQGAIKVTGAGIGTHTAAFVHVATASNTAGDNTLIDNPIINSVPGALLFVTHNFSPSGGAYNYLNKSFGVFYQPNPTNKWCIYQEDVSTMPAGLSFNVLAILP